LDQSPIDVIASGINFPFNINASIIYFESVGSRKHNTASHPDHFGDTGSLRRRWTENKGMDVTGRNYSILRERLNND